MFKLYKVIKMNDIMNNLSLDPLAELKILMGNPNSNEFKKNKILNRISFINTILNSEDPKMYFTHRYKGDWDADKIAKRKKQLIEERNELLSHPLISYNP